ncbi:MAG: type II secretion system F family protein [Candidatus Omnitrophica bacterium]|nr:type II secretion system F family protein [Candidatus Omnitrophota bacterium]MCM8801881.1 type II secretion system F family protein [Candidatus Omnitrophota bacterium]
MPTFIYTILDKKGKIKKGKKDSENLNKLKDEIQKEGYYILSIKEWKKLNFLVFNRIREEDLIVAIKELSTFLSSKIPLDEALSGLIIQMKEGKLKNIFMDIQKSIREGVSFSNALKKYSDLFSNMFISMVKVGEETGNLDLVLSRIADFLEKRNAFKNKIKVIMTYPVFMCIVAFFVLIFILSFIVPTITRIFSEISLNLPILTKILIKIANFLRFFWIYSFLFVILLLLLVKNFLKTKKGKMIFENILWKVPFLNDIFLKREIINFSKTLSTLINGGVDIIDSLNIGKEVLNSINIKKEIEKLTEYVSKGGSISSGFSKCKYFPYLFTQLVSAGERSGNLSEMLDKVGDIYQEELSQKSMRFVTFLEPFMILFMGGIIGFIVISVLLPIFQISQSIK